MVDMHLQSNQNPWIKIGFTNEDVYNLSHGFRHKWTANDIALIL